MNTEIEMATSPIQSLRPIPPESAQYLGLEEFYDAFTHLAAEVKHRIFKLERLQTYIEPDNESWNEFQRGNVRHSLELLREHRAKDVQFDLDFFSRGLQFLRIRAVELPLTPYIEWELQGHVVNAQYGETILVADLTDAKRDGLVWNTRDYLLFDGFAALIHNYDTNGQLRGGWLCAEAELTGICSDLSSQLTRISQPLGVFLDRHPFTYHLL